MRALGVIEADPAGPTFSGVEWQPAMYAEGLPAEVRLKALTVDGRLPFVFEASATETHFTNGFDPDARACRLFHFPKPSTLARIPFLVDRNNLADQTPSPEHQSAAVAACRELIDGVERFKETVTGQCKRSAALRRSLLAAAFSGRLTGSDTDLSVAEEMIGA